MTALMSVLGFFTSNLWRTASIGLLAALAFYHFVTVPALEHKISNMRAVIAELNAAVQIQNKAVDQWKNEADRAKENQRQAMEVAEKAMKKTQGTVTTILKEPVPVPDKECEATLALLRKYQ